MSKYKHTKVTTDKIQIEGIIDVENMTVDVDGNQISIADELSLFDGKSIALTFIEKTEENVDGE